jgi:hypothetical protein
VPLGYLAAEPVNVTPSSWVPLVAAGIVAIVGTLAGAVVTQWRSDVREEANAEREQQRERERWAREDQLRNFEARSDAYISFYESLREMARTAYDYGMGLSDALTSGEDADDELGIARFEWHMPTVRCLERLRVYAANEVLGAADAAYGACWRWGHHTHWGQDNERFYGDQATYDLAELAFFDAMRRDLGLPTVIGEDGAPLPGSGWTSLFSWRRHQRPENRGPRSDDG